MSRRSFRSKYRGHHHAQLHLPPLSGSQALLIANLFDRAIAALWRAHGESMAEVLSDCGPDKILVDQPGATDAHLLNEDDLF